MNATIRRADPAAGLTVDPMSEDADEMLHAILSLPPAAPTAPRRGGRYVAAMVGAAAAAAIAVPVFWPSSSGPAAAAYAVTEHADGSVDVAIDFDRFKDPKALQQALDDRHVPSVVLSGPGVTVQVGADGTAGGPGAPPDCAKYHRHNDNTQIDSNDPNQPVSFISSTRFDNSGLRLRPDLLPANGTFVIDIVKSNGEIRGFGGDVAIGKPPTCLYTD